MEDISDALNLADTEPQEAAENINRSKIFDMPPSEYKKLKPELDQEAEILERPSEATRGVAEFVKQDDQVVSLVKNDIAENKLSYYEAYSSYFKTQVFDIPTNQRQQSDIIDKYFTDPDSVTEHDELALEVLNEEQDDLGIENFGITGTWEQLPVKVAAAISEVWKGVEDNSALVAGIVGTQTAAGALVGSAVPGAGTVAGAGAGFATGLGNAALVAGFLDSYKQTRNSIYNELSRSSETNNLNMSRDTKLNVSIGVGLVGGVVNGALGKMLIKKTPFLNKFISPKAVVSLINNPALRAKLDVLGNIIKSAGAGGTAAITTEVAKIVGTRLAETEGTEEGLLDALGSLTSKENLKRLKEAGLVGTATAGTISTALNLPGYKGLKARYTDINKKVGAALGDDQTIVVRDDGTYDIETIINPEKPSGPGTQNFSDILINKSVKALEAQDTINNMSKLATTTDLKKFSSGEMSNFRKAMFSIGGVNKNVYLHIEDLRKFSDDPEKAAAARKLIDKTGVLTAERNGPVAVPLYKVLDVVEDYPELSDYLRMNPEDPNPLEARNYVERKIEAEGKRGEILSTLGAEEVLTPEQESNVQQILKPTIEAGEVVGEYEFYDRPTFTKAIEGVLSEEQVQKFNTAQVDARLLVAQSMKNDVNKEFKAKTNKTVKEIRQDIKEVSESVQLTNDFAAKNVKHDFVKDLKANHKKKGFSPYAIDPKFLPEQLREALISDPKLIKRKVFVEGGMTPEEAASMLNVETGGELLKVLANSPDKTELLNVKRQQEIELRNQIEQAFKPDKEDALIKAYNNLSKAHAREMKAMKDGSWTQTKSGIKKISLPLPRIDELVTRSKEIVSKTPIKDLNVNQHLVGERRSQKLAVNHILKNEVEQAFKAKENAILNNELAKETVLVKRQLEKNNKFLNNMKNKKTINTIKEAGMFDAVDEILDVFNLDPSKRGVSKQGSYDKYVESMVKQGRGDFAIPEKFNDIREHVSEMNIEQHTGITNFLRGIVHQAKMKNKLRTEFRKKEVIQTVEATVQESGDLLVKHPDFNENRSREITTDNFTEWESIQRIGRTVGTLTDTLKTLALTLDEEKLGGFHNDLLVNRLTDREIRAFERYDEHIKFVKKQVNTYGVKNFNEAFNDIREIPEFKGFDSLTNDGFVRKSHLMDLLAYMGDPGGLERIGNFVNNRFERMTPETVMKVLNRELDETDARFVQEAVLNPYKAHEESSFALHKRTTGEDITMVQGVSFVHRGKVYPGGYYPLKTQAVSDETKIQKAGEAIQKGLSKFSTAFGVVDVEDFSNWTASKMTNQDRLKSRTGSTRPLKLDLRKGMFDGIESIIHDEAFREIGIDLNNLYGNAQFAKNVKGVVGPESFRIMYNSTFELIGRAEERNANYFREQLGFLEKMITNFKSGHAVATMGFSLGSIAIQAASIPNAALRMGKGGGQSIASALQTMVANPEMIPEFIKIVHSVNPKIKFNQDGIDDSLIKSTNEFVPRTYAINKKWKKSSSVKATLKKGQAYVNDIAMSGMRHMDDFTKVTVSLGAINHFTSGKVENFPLSKISKMTNDEKFQAMSKYVQQVTETSLTSSSVIDKTAVEKVALGKLFTNYYTDTRNALNTQFSSVRKIKWAGKQSWEDVKDKEYRKASNEARKVLDETLRLLMYVTAATAFIDSIRDEETPLSNLEDLKTPADYQERAEQAMYYVMQSVPNAMSDEAVFIRDIKYGASSKTRSDYKSVSIPLLKSATDIATAYNGLADFLEDVLIEGDIDAGTLSRTQKKALGFTTSYIVGGIPVNGPMKIVKAITEGETIENLGDTMTNEAKRLNAVINDVIQLLGGKKESESFVEDIQQVQKELLVNLQPKKDIEEVIPEDSKEVIKQISSEGKWTSKNSDTGAVGIYQFTEERWIQISLAEPSLGLTDNGRVAKDSKQQEKAMDWSMQNNTQGFLSLDIPVNTETLYGSHRFGFENYINIYDANRNDSLTKLLGNDIGNDPLFKGFTTVKSVQDHIDKEVKKNN